MAQDPADKSSYWIAQEALNAALPPGWVEHKTAEDAVYYFNADTKESSWEHPTDDYYRFLYKKMRKMRKQRQVWSAFLPNPCSDLIRIRRGGVGGGVYCFIVERRSGRRSKEMRKMSNRIESDLP